MKHRIGAWLVRLGCLCILVSLVFLTHNIREEQQVEQATDTALTGVQQAIADGEGEAETVTVDGEQYLGYLSIPDLNLTLPILSTWDFNRLKIAPCRYSGSLTDCKLVIAAHNYVRHFAKLYTLKKGCRIGFTDTAGREYRYTVQAIQRLKPTDGERMVSEDWDLTLFTCTYRGNLRVAVRCTQEK